MNPTENYNSIENIISIYSFSGDYICNFSAFLTDFNDKTTSNWSSQEIYGRMDPIHTYKNTTRKISISFDVPSFDLIESKKNYDNINKIMDGLYPTFSDTAAKGDAIIGSPPFFKIRFSNLINGGQQKNIIDNSLINYGLLGWIDAITFGPELESGFFIEEEKDLYPKLFKINFTFNVVHENELGKYLSTEQSQQRLQEVKRSRTDTQNFANSANSTIPASDSKKV